MAQVTGEDVQVVERRVTMVLSAEEAQRVRAALHGVVADDGNDLGLLVEQAITG